MKHKGQIIITVLFFLLINSSYYWEGQLGSLGLPIFIFLVLVYFGLVVVLLRQLYFAFKEKFTEKSRFILIGLLAIVLTLTFIKPSGLIDFDNFNGINLLIASREGGGNCITTIKLKDNNTFRERNVCFGITEIKGNYNIINDTIFFENVEFRRRPYEFYKFAVIRQSKFKGDNKNFNLVRFINLKDTTGEELWITKNQLYNLKGKKPNR